MADGRYTTFPMWWPESLVGLIGRGVCRLFGWHNETCRGRADHRPLLRTSGLDVISEVPPPHPALNHLPPPDFED